MTTDAERIAEAFHETYERTAPRVGYRTRQGSAVPWEQVPHVNRLLMRATVQQLLAAGIIAPGSALEEERVAHAGAG